MYQEPIYGQPDILFGTIHVWTVDAVLGGDSPFAIFATGSIYRNETAKLFALTPAHGLSAGSENVGPELHREIRLVVVVRRVEPQQPSLGTIILRPDSMTIELHSVALFDELLMRNRTGGRMPRFAAVTAGEPASTPDGTTWPILWACLRMHNSELVVN